MATGVTASSASTGTSIGTSAGTVTGILGQALAGNMTFNGTDNFGNTVVRTGTVTILPDGALTYNWTDTVTNSGVTKATGSGTSTQTPGTYFSQSVTGPVMSSANLAGNLTTSSNYGDLTGTRVENGITTSIRAGFSVTGTAPNAGTFTSADPALTNTSEGVLGAPDANGVRLGVVTYGTPAALSKRRAGA